MGEVLEEQISTKLILAPPTIPTLDPSTPQTPTWVGKGMNFNLMMILTQRTTKTTFMIVKICGVDPQLLNDRRPLNPLYFQLLRTITSLVLFGARPKQKKSSPRNLVRITSRHPVDSLRHKGSSHNTISTRPCLAWPLVSVAIPWMKPCDSDKNTS